MVHLSWFLDWTTLLTLCGTFVLAVGLWDRWKYRNLPPGPPPLPLLGNLFITWSLDFFMNFDHLARDYGPLFTVYRGRTPVIICSSFEMLQDMFVKHGALFVDRPNHYFSMNIMSKTGEHGVSMANGHKWKTLRNASVRLMKEVGTLQGKLERKVLRESELMEAQLRYQTGRPFSPYKHLQSASANIISSIIFGSRFDYEDPDFMNLLNIFENLFASGIRKDALALLNFSHILQLIFVIGTKVSRKAAFMLKSIDDFKAFATRSIKEHRSTFDPKTTRDFVDLFLHLESSEGDSKFIENEFLLNIFNLYFAASDTTSHSLEWALLYMIAYPDIQQKCADEIAEKVGLGRQITMDDRRRLPFVHATLSETQRMSNTGSVTLPRQAIHDTTFRGYDIPKNALIMGDLHSALKDPKHWRDPETFNPAHFLDEDGEYRHNKAFIPFSLGPRMCLGDSTAKTELFLFFANLLQKFEFSKVTEDQKLNLVGKVLLLYVPDKYELVCKPRSGS